MVRQMQRMKLDKFQIQNNHRYLFFVLSGFQPSKHGEGGLFEGKNFIKYLI